MYEYINDNIDIKMLQRQNEQVPQGGPSFMPNFEEESLNETEEEFPSSAYKSEDQEPATWKIKKPELSRDESKESIVIDNPGGRCEYIRIEANEETHEEGMELESEGGIETEIWDESIPDEIDQSKSQSFDALDLK